MAKEKDASKEQSEPKAADQAKPAAPPQTAPTDTIGVKTDHPPLAPAVEKVPPGQLGAQALEGITDMKGPGVTDHRGEYRPRQDVHLARAGRVALENWTGRVNGKRVRVYRGAPADQIPADVQAAMQKSGCGIGELTFEDLGLRTPQEDRGARVVNVKEG